MRESDGDGQLLVVFSFYQQQSWLSIIYKGEMTMLSIPSTIFLLVHFLARYQAFQINVEKNNIIYIPKRADHILFRATFFTLPLTDMEASVAAALKNTTLSLPPSGVIPTLANSVSGKPHVFVGYGICIPLIVVVSTLRLYAKLTILEVKPWTDCDLFSKLAFMNHLANHRM